MVRKMQILLTRCLCNHSFKNHWQSWNFAFSAETTANWNTHDVEKWTIPLDIVIVKLFTVGIQICP